jgi:glyoxylase-like metal-dependent hydrolase (beta-lactamase superfamily II)
MKFFLFDTGFIKVKPGDLFLGISETGCQSLYPVDENGLCTLSLRSLLIVDGTKKIIIDTGIGGTIDKDFLDLYQYRHGRALDVQLADLSVGTEDVTDIILTHLHFDHCGGSVVKESGKALTGSPYTTVFPNAVYWVSRRHWEWACDHNHREPDTYFDHTFIPIKEKGNLQLVEKEKTIIPGIDVVICDGHTVGLMLPLIHTHRPTVAFAGDLIPTAAHVNPSCQMSYDLDPVKNRHEKTNFLRKAVQEDWIIVLQHDHYYECCRVEVTGEGYAVKEICSAESL